MKRLFLIIASLILLISCSKKEVNVSLTIQRGGFVYEANKTEALSGIVFDVYENGQRKFEHTFKKGKANGKLTYWYENGQKQREGALRDGNQHGRWTYWTETGEVLKVERYEDGKLVETTFPK